jgi:hypothetical protein
MKHQLGLKGDYIVFGDETYSRIRFYRDARIRLFKQEMLVLANGLICTMVTNQDSKGAITKKLDVSFRLKVAVNHKTFKRTVP